MQEKVWFQNEKGKKLCGILSDPGESETRPVVLLCHGRNSSKESRTHVTLEKLLNAKGIATFRFDFSGHGESEGSFEDFTVSEAVDDIFRALDMLKVRGYSMIGLVGSSMGGLAGMIVAAHSRDLSALALKAPVSDYVAVERRRLGDEGVRQWSKKAFEELRKLSGYEAAKRITIPTLIVHGDADDVVPVSQSKRTARMIKNCRLYIIAGADHDFSQRKEHFDTMANTIVAFLVQHLKGPV